ncbi:hypothetical protein [Pseudoalteromonas umbrosa]|uniref:hypothetical protein n=1 Tax=Pseudoalteromonas umbrosa TaxID=3048489 RepID=UPI0024C292EC|nr:hypothetical protein [Pseudoalteromonas sp. B95]MDK1287428.1 hypothetical protein [Pseudoalteromonas sp. B95]
MTSKHEVSDTPKATGVSKVIDHTQALSLALNILDKWGCSSKQKEQILAIKIKQIEAGFVDIKLSDEQLIRCSHVANIHAILRAKFTNPRNIYGFMSMKNNNPLFKGKSPISHIESGHLNELQACHETLKSGLFGPP